MQNKKTYDILDIINIDEYLIIYKMEEFDMPCMQDRPVMEIIYIKIDRFFKK